MIFRFCWPRKAEAQYEHIPAQQLKWQKKFSAERFQLVTVKLRREVPNVRSLLDLGKVAVPCRSE